MRKIGQKPAPFFANGKSASRLGKRREGDLPEEPVRAYEAGEERPRARGRAVREALP